MASGRGGPLRDMAGAGGEAGPGGPGAWSTRTGAGAGTVVVYTMWDVANAQWNGFPQGGDGVATNELRDAVAQGDQLTVANAIYPQRPIARPVDFTFAALLPNTAAMQAAVSAAIGSMFVRKGSALGTTIYQSDWNGAIEAIPGLLEFAVSSPATQVAIPLGYLPTLGTLTWPS